LLEHLDRGARRCFILSCHGESGRRLGRAHAVRQGEEKSRSERRENDRRQRGALEVRSRSKHVFLAVKHHRRFTLWRGALFVESLATEERLQSARSMIGAIHA
jgi:hypothetical protein